MRRNLMMGLTTAVTVAALAACRAPGQDHEAIQRAAELAGGQVNVAGCLQEGDEPGRFVVTNAMLAEEPAGAVIHDETAPPPPMVGEPSTTGTIPAVLTGPSYTLEAPANVNLQAHVGRQVQVTGMLEPHEGGRPVGTAGEYGSLPDRQPDADGHIVADQVRLIAQTCM